LKYLSETFPETSYKSKFSQKIIYISLFLSLFHLILGMVV